MALKRVAIGALLLSASNALRLLFQFALLPILARTIETSQYGVVAVALPIVAFAQLFSEGGLGQSLVKEEIDRRLVWSSLFWFLLGLGSLASLGLIIFSPFLAALYSEPELRLVVIVLSMICIIQALTVVPLAVLQRTERYAVIAAGDIAGSVLGGAIAIFLALRGFGAWALVAQQISIWLARMSVVWWSAGFVPIYSFSFRSAVGHLRFGRDIVAFNLINYFARSFDPLIVGKVIGLSAVGMYSIGYQLMRLPAQLITGPVQSVFYTQLVKRNASRTEARVALLLASRLVAIVVFPVMILMAAAHVPIFRVVFSEKWMLGGKIFALFSFVGAVQAVAGLNGAVLMATGNTRIQLSVAVEFSCLWVPVLIVAAHFGLFAVPIAYSVAWFGYFPRFALLFLPAIDCSIREYLYTMVVPVLLAILGYCSYCWLDNWLSPGDGGRIAVVICLMFLLIFTGAAFQLKSIRRGLYGISGDVPLQ